MRSMLAAFLATPALLIAVSAGAQDAGAPDGAVAEVGPEGPRGILGLELPENQERHQTILLRNFLDMDLNGDLLLAASEWDVWTGWTNSPPPDFASIDVNASSYLSYREYEDAALTMEDARLGHAMHGTAPPQASGSAE